MPDSEDINVLLTEESVYCYSINVTHSRYVHQQHPHGMVTITSIVRYIRIERQASTDSDNGQGSNKNPGGIQRRAVAGRDRATKRIDSRRSRNYRDMGVIPRNSQRWRTNTHHNPKIDDI